MDTPVMLDFRLGLGLNANLTTIGTYSCAFFIIEILYNQSFDYFLNRYIFFISHTPYFSLMTVLPHFLQPVSSDRALDVLTNSMWSTMMITGLFFMSFLFVFLIIKVGQSIGAESIDIGPIEYSFLFSFSGIRYMNNHVRHHLFKTPLLPRRRYSSLSTSWLPGILKRASFTSCSNDIFSQEKGLRLGTEKSRRNSSSIDTSRRSSTAYKSKRLSVPYIQVPGTTNNTGIKPNTHSTVANNNSPKTISRRNTLPNLSVSSELLTNNNNIIAEKNIPEHQIYEDILPLRDNRGSLSIINEEELTQILDSPVNEENVIIESKLLPVIEEENIDDLEDSNRLFGEINSDISDYIFEEDPSIDAEESKYVPIQNSSQSINIMSQSSTSELNPETSSPKPSSFRSAYFNYLPDSIFGYSTSILKSNTVPESPPIDTFSAPPGFSKRSASHDLTNSATNEFSNSVGEGFNNHQPLYARRRTETSKMLSEAAKSIFPFNMPSFSTNIAKPDSGPNRSNTASPCLSDLQNTDDLFAPINWNFSTSEQSKALRRSWDAAEEDEKSEAQSKIASDSSATTALRRKSTSFSFFFEGY
jgi:hypothetical protein